ncbi:MAG: hypothetical protein NVSMB5_19950 [Candidatus Velthaea sp.]
MDDHDPHEHYHGTPFIGGDFPTQRASETVVASDGGSFMLHLIERRPIALEPGEVQSADHEVGRFALSPVVLVQLRANIDDAIAKHTLIFGAPPLGPEHLPVDAMDAARRSILNGLPVSPSDSEHQ